MTIKINGMSCEHCVKAVEKALKDIKGIKNIKVGIGQASFDAPQNADTANIKSAVEDAGYEVISIE
jgi:copper ion binding protein